MRKILMVVLLTFVIASGAVFAAEPDFRNVNWGMTVNEVLQSEDGDPVILEEGKTYCYEVAVAGFNDVYLYYSFVEDQLTSAMYGFAGIEHTNQTDYIDDYYRVLRLLSKKYGDPINERVNWKDPLYKDSEEDYGMSVATGKHEYYAEWETTSNLIKLNLFGDNYKIYLTLSYSGKEFKDIADEAREEDNLEGL